MRRVLSRTAGMCAVVLTATLAVAPTANAAQPPSGKITTLAGNGLAGGPNGDGGPATQARIDTPSGVTRDAAGNTYVTEYWSSRVRKIAPNGIITTIAGNGGYGSGPDGGPATGIPLLNPSGVVVDAQGNVYFSDAGDHRVRKVAPNGVISTVAGVAGTIPPGGNVGDGGSALVAKLNGPTGLARDGGGNLYIADTNNNRIRKVDPSGVITTVAGTGIAGNAADQLNHPHGVAVDGRGALWIADTDNNRVLKGTTVQVPGADPLPYNHPKGIAVDPGGNVYVADTGNNRIRSISFMGRSRPFAGTGSPGFSGDNGSATFATMDTPVAVFVDAAANVVVADQSNNRVRAIAGQPLITRIAGILGKSGHSGDGGPATSAEIGVPGGVAVDKFGNVFFGDDNTDIRKITPQGVISTFVHGGTNRAGMAFDRNGNLYAAEGDSTIRRYDTAGNSTVVAGKPGVAGFSGDGGPATAATLGYPGNLTVDNAGNLYIVDTNNFRIRKVDTNGVITTVAGDGVAGPGTDGVQATASHLAFEGSSSWKSGGVAVDSKGRIYIADFVNNRIRRVDTNGVISTFAGTGQYTEQGPNLDGAQATAIDMGYAYDVKVDAQDNVYFPALSNVLKVGADGVVHVVAGVGRFPGDRVARNMYPCLGDGGPAVLADLFFPEKFTLDAAGNMYLPACNLIRKVAAS